MHLFMRVSRVVKTAIFLWEIKLQWTWDISVTLIIAQKRP